MKHFFVKTFFAAFLVLFTLGLNAQSAGSNNTDKSNILKINIPALFFKNFSLQYERKLNRNRSFAVSMRYRPEGNIPFQKIVEDMVDDTSIQVGLTRIGNFAITPEYRFYLGKKGAMQGLYIGGFISYNHYKGAIPVNYDDYDDVNHVGIDRTGIFKGSANTFTAGLQLGAQWTLSDKFTLDWWILGPNYGLSNGAFSFDGALNDYERISLDLTLNYKIKPSLPLDIIKSVVVTENGASFKVKGPWMGIRAFGINLGYRF